MFTNCLRPVAYLAIGVLTLALAQSANAQGCRGGGGGMGGGMMGGGGMGGGYMGGMGQPYGMMGGMGNGGMMGGMGQSYGMMGGMGNGCMGRSNGMTGGYQGQGQNGTGSQNYSSMQQAVTSSTSESVNNPATVLAHTADLNLTSKQVQVLEKMLNSGRQRAALVLTKAQRKTLAQIISVVPKSRST